MSADLARLEDQVISFHKLLQVKLGDQAVTGEHQLLKLAEEVAELREALADHRADNGAGQELQGELADVIIVALMLGTCEGVWAGDVLQAVQAKMDVNLGRNWAFQDGVVHHYDNDSKEA